MPAPFTPRRPTMLPRLKAGLARPTPDVLDDILGAVAVFALPVIMLAIGALLDGGM